MPVTSLYRQDFKDLPLDEFTARDSSRISPDNVSTRRSCLRSQNSTSSESSPMRRVRFSEQSIQVACACAQVDSLSLGEDDSDCEKRTAGDVLSPCNEDHSPERVDCAPDYAATPSIRNGKAVVPPRSAHPPKPATVQVSCGLSRSGSAAGKKARTDKPKRRRRS